MQARLLQTRARQRQIYVLLIIMKVELDRGKVLGVLQCVRARFCVFNHDYSGVGFSKTK